MKRRIALTLLFAANLAVPPTGGALAEELRIIELTVNQRQISIPEQTLRVDEGERVELRIASDEAGELHLHGYDVTIPLQAGKTTTKVIDATVAGRFPIAAHGFGGHSHGHKPLFYLEVYPR